MSQNLSTFLHDANHFVITFREIIEMNVPHIYLSALPSVHRTSKIAEVFRPLYPFTVKVTARGFQKQQNILLELRGHTGAVRSVGFSPDGTRIVSGSEDKTIRIWDANTGDEVMKPLNGIPALCGQSGSPRMGPASPRAHLTRRSGSGMRGRGR